MRPAMGAGARAASSNSVATAKRRQVSSWRNPAPSTRTRHTARPSGVAQARAVVLEGVEQPVVLVVSGQARPSASLSWR